MALIKVLHFLPVKIITYSKKYYLSDTKLGRTGTELWTLLSILGEGCFWIYQWFLVIKDKEENTIGKYFKF